MLKQSLKLKNKSPAAQFPTSVENTGDIVLGKANNLGVLKLSPFSDSIDYMTLSDPKLLHGDILLTNFKILSRKHTYFKFQNIAYCIKEL